MFNSGIADGFCGTAFCKENCRKCVRNGSFKAYIFIEANDESPGWTNGKENNAKTVTYGIAKPTVRCFLISVLDFHFDKDDKSALEWYTMRKASGGKLGERLNVIFFDLLKIKKLLGTPPEKLTKLEKWGLFLSYAEDEAKKDYLESLILSEEGIMNAKTALCKVSQDDINWAIENSIFKDQMDYNTGLYNAEQRGIKQGELNTARRMLEAKICSLEQIADMTNLSIEEVKGLQKQVQG
ncbi:MAG: PD-(D/E)XK nuclease family transposase [Treponema sp.]|nr:PD-(D/E)XK nuclease family transposase [Treponema sp.]